MVEIDWMTLVMGLLGGLALFLFGLEQITGGLQAAAGESMKYILGKLTHNRVTGALTGAFVTAVLNSSSVTTVLVVGFISAGLLNLSQSIGIIMGANVGTTVTGQIVAFNVTKYALAMIAIGFAMIFVGKRDRIRQVGTMIMGLGMLFLGMEIMGTAMAPLRSYQPFMDLMIRMEEPILGILVGAGFSALVQSSSATTSLAIVMASEGLITLPAGIALALGANIGTCVTAMLAAMGKPREAQRAAASHVAFNVIGVLLWLGLIDQLALLAQILSPAHPELEEAARLAAETPREIANANTLFNVANTMLLLPFAGLLARLVTRLLPDRPVVEKEIVKPLYLDRELVTKPALALERVRLELGHVGEILDQMFGKLSRAYEERSRECFAEVARMDDQVDILHANIVEYLELIQNQKLSRAESEDFVALLSAANYAESIGDILETALADLGNQMLDNNVEASEVVEMALQFLAESVRKATVMAIDSIRLRSAVEAQKVLGYKDYVNRQIDELMQHQAGKLSPEAPGRVTVFRIEMGIVDALKRAYTLTKRIARLSIPKEVLVARQGL